MLYVVLGLAHEGHVRLGRFTEKGQEKEEGSPNTVLPEEEEREKEDGGSIERTYNRRRILLMIYIHTCNTHTSTLHYTTGHTYIHTLIVTLTVSLNR